jgi:hypothetical protein
MWHEIKFNGEICIFLWAAAHTFKNRGERNEHSKSSAEFFSLQISVSVSYGQDAGALDDQAPAALA